MRIHATDAVYLIKRTNKLRIKESQRLIAGRSSDTHT